MVTVWGWTGTTLNYLYRRDCSFLTDSTASSSLCVRAPVGHRQRRDRRNKQIVVRVPSGQNFFGPCLAAYRERSARTRMVQSCSRSLFLSRAGIVLVASHAIADARLVSGSDGILQDITKLNGVVFVKGWTWHYGRTLTHVETRPSRSYANWLSVAVL